MRSFLNWLVDHVLVHVPGLGRLLRGLGREDAPVSGRREADATAPSPIEAKRDRL